jgi:hypothetical protein
MPELTLVHNSFENKKATFLQIDFLLLNKNQTAFFFAASLSANHQVSHASVNVTAGALHYERLQSCLRLPEPEGHLCLILPPLQALVPAFQSNL